MAPVPPMQPSPRKRRGGEAPPATRTKRLRSGTMEELEPFSFLITLPPLVYSQGYEALSDFLEARINHDLSCSAAPFAAPPLPTAALREIGCEQAAAECWQRLASAVNSSGQLKQNWFKFCVVDKILSLADRSKWREKNAEYCELEKKVWWVTIAKEWFSGRQLPLSDAEYLEVGLAALILESFYRFVWTLHVRSHLEEMHETHAAAMGDSEGEGEGDLPMMVAPDSDLALEEVFETADLGECGDSDDEDEGSNDAVAEEAGEEVVDDDILLTSEEERDDNPNRKPSANAAHSGDSAPLLPFASEVSEMDTESVGAIAATAAPKRRITPCMVALHPAAHGESDESNGSGNCSSGPADDDDDMHGVSESTDDAAAVTRRARRSLRDKSPYLLASNDDNNQYNDLPRDVGYAGDIDNCELEDGEDVVVSEDDPRTLASANRSSRMVPEVVTLFFTHPTIREAIDGVEQRCIDACFSEDGAPVAPVAQLLNFVQAWDILPVVRAFATLAVRRARDRLRHGDIAPTEDELLRRLRSMYVEKFVPFLRRVGITVQSGCSIWEWAWSEHVSFGFISQVYVQPFCSLTSNGRVPNASILMGLFPDLCMISDTRVDSHLPGMCYSLEQFLRKKGVVNDDIDALVHLLDELLEERKRLRQPALPSFPSSNIMPSQMTVKLESTLQSTRSRRLDEVESALAAVQNEYHRLTGAIDQIPSRRRMSEPGVCAMPTPKKVSGDYPLGISLQSASILLDLASTITLSPRRIVSIGALDIAIPVVAHCFFRIPILLYTCSLAVRKIAANRLFDMHKHFQNEMAEKVRDILLCKPAEAKAFAVQVQDALDMHLTSDQHEVVVTQFGKVKRARTNATKAKQIAAKKIAKAAYSPLQADVCPFTSQTEKSCLAALELCERESAKRGQTLLLALPSSSLWSMRFKRKQAWEKLQSLKGSVRVLVINKIDPDDYFGDVCRWLPWQIVGRARLLEENTFQMQDDEDDRFSWIYTSMNRQGNEKERRFVENYSPCIRDLYVFELNPPQPTFLKRVFACHSIHWSNNRCTEPFDVGQDQGDDKDISTIPCSGSAPHVWSASFCVSPDSTLPNDAISGPSIRSDEVHVLCMFALRDDVRKPPVRVYRNRARWTQELRECLVGVLGSDTSDDDEAVGTQQNLFNRCLKALQRAVQVDGGALNEAAISHSGVVVVVSANEAALLQTDGGCPVWGLVETANGSCFTVPTETTGLRTRLSLRYWRHTSMVARSNHVTSVVLGCGMLRRYLQQQPSSLVELQRSVAWMLLEQLELQPVECHIGPIPPLLWEEAVVADVQYGRLNRMLVSVLEEYALHKNLRCRQPAASFAPGDSLLAFWKSQSSQAEDLALTCLWNLPLIAGQAGASGKPLRDAECRANARRNVSGTERPLQMNDMEDAFAAQLTV